MITSVTIEYALPHRPIKRVSYDVFTASEAVAFDEAVENLKLDLLMKARHQIPSDPFTNNAASFRAAALAILRLKPWANSYEYTKEVEAGA